MIICEEVSHMFMAVLNFLAVCAVVVLLVIAIIGTWVVLDNIL